MSITTNSEAHKDSKSPAQQDGWALMKLHAAEKALMPN